MGTAFRHSSEQKGQKLLLSFIRILVGRERQIQCITRQMDVSVEKLLQNGTIIFNIGWSKRSKAGVPNLWAIDWYWSMTC